MSHQLCGFLTISLSPFMKHISALTQQPFLQPMNVAVEVCSVTSVCSVCDISFESLDIET